MKTDLQKAEEYDFYVELHNLINNLTYIDVTTIQLIRFDIESCYSADMITYGMREALKIYLDKKIKSMINAKHGLKECD